MDELAKSKRLMAEILGRAANIQSHMDAVDKRWSSMHSTKATNQRNGQETQKTAPRVSLLDMPDDVLVLVTKHLQSYDSLVALSKVSLRMG